MSPEDRILDYLFAHRTGMMIFTVDEAVGQIKLFLFYNMSPLKDDEIKQIIIRWATFNCPMMMLNPQTKAGTLPAAQKPGDPPPANSSEMIDSVKKALSTVNDGVKFGNDKNNAVIKVTGPTVNLKSGNQSASLAISWSGTLDLNAQSGPFNFAGTLAKDKWELSLSFPRDSFIPVMSDLGKVFSEGEKSLRNLAAASSQFNNLEEARKISALVKPDISAVKEAVDALSSIGDHPTTCGGYSFGFKIGSPDPMPGQNSMPQGYKGTVVFTYTF